jgi:hypothetical protein
MPCQRLSGMLAVIKVLPLTTHFLIVFMPFACDQNHIARISANDDLLNRRPAIHINKQSRWVIGSIGANPDSPLS